MRPPRLSAGTIRELARQSGVTLTPEAAEALAAELDAVLDADDRIAALHLGTLSPLGPTWSDERRD